MPTRIDRGWWPAALAAYAAVGSIAGSGVLHAMAASAGARPGVGTFAAINLVMPAAAVIIAIAYPALWSAAAGALLMMAAFVATRLMIGNPNPVSWTWGYVGAMTHPIEVVATAGYAVLGVVAALAVRPLRAFRLTDGVARCPACEYELAGAVGPACPECGSALGSGR
jgi:hypothetical protein